MGDIHEWAGQEKKQLSTKISRGWNDGGKRKNVDILQVKGSSLLLAHAISR